MSTTSPQTTSRLYGVMAELQNADDLLRAVRAARTAGFVQIEAYTPHPVEEISHELGHKSHLPAIVLVGGVIGALTGFTLQYYAAVVAYPIRVAGKPAASWPAFVVVAFELTILFAALAAVFGMFVLNGLPQPYHPVFNVPIFELASRNRFFILLRSRDPRFDPVTTRRFLEQQTSLQVVDVPL
jgi:hypothetical protein